MSAAGSSSVRDPGSSTLSFMSAPAITEVDEIYILPAAVLGDLQEVDHACKPRAARKFWRHVGKFDLADLGHLHMASAERVAAAHLHARSLPDAHATGDLTALDRVVQPFG